MTWRYGRRSLARLATCHEHLQLLMNTALADPRCPSDISIIEGHRGRERQNALKAEGKSQLSYPRSKHNSSPSLAVDVAPYIDGSISWDWAHYRPLAAHIEQVWRELFDAGRVSGSLEWGGTWRRFPDAPHWQLNDV